MKEATLKTVIENAHGVALNMNDTFYYACADSACIDIDELEDLEPVIERFGYRAFIAYEAIKRGHDPQIPSVVTAEYKAAKATIEAMIAGADEFGAFYGLRQCLKMEAKTPKEKKRVSRFRAKLKDFYSFFYGR